MDKICNGRIIKNCGDCDYLDKSGELGNYTHGRCKTTLEIIENEPRFGFSSLCPLENVKDN